MTSPERQEGARIIPLPRRRRSRHELEFLPAALEVVETPPSPLGRGLIFTILTFACIAVAWSWLGHVDIIATARGHIVPNGRTKVVQPVDSGIVQEIRVQDGDHVHAGVTLIKLDDSIARADRDRVGRDLMISRLDTARLSALALESDPKEVLKTFLAPAGVSKAQLDVARSFAVSQATEQAAKIANLDQQIIQKDAAAQEILAGIEKLKVTLPILEEKLKLREELLRLEYGNRFAFLDAEQALFEAQHDIDVQESRIVETKAARDALERERDQTKAEYAHKVLSDLSEAEQKVSELTQDLVKAERKLTETELRAPIDGVVQQLTIHTIGGVVTPAEQLMVIVPENQKLIVQAMVSNDDVGFIHVGQETQIKVETFNFTRYGLVHGRVIDISPDVVTEDQRSQEHPSDQADSDKQSENPEKANSSYVARIALNETHMMIDGREEFLRPGMAVTTEIKTGSRRILDYLLSPLRKYAQEAIRER